jgi:hypothetical protein
MFIENLLAEIAFDAALLLDDPADLAARRPSERSFTRCPD